jgi:hypothetical protein
MVRVVAGVADPNPIATGGAETLRSHGIDVEIGLRADEVYAGNLAWLTATRRAAAGDPRPVRHLEVRVHDGWSGGRPRRHQPVDQLPRRPGRRAGAALHSGRHHGRGRHRASPTTRT